VITLEQTGFAMEDALVELGVAQVEDAAEQQAILESIQSELEVEANRRYIHEVDMAHEELFADEEMKRTRRSFAPPPMTMVAMSKK
jgi:hypothetical protein